MSMMMRCLDTYATGTVNGRPPELGLPVFLIRVPANRSVSCERCGSTTWSGFDVDWKHVCSAADEPLT